VPSLSSQKNTGSIKSDRSRKTLFSCSGPVAPYCVIGPVFSMGLPFSSAVRIVLCFSFSHQFAFNNKVLRRKTIIVLRLSRTEPGTSPSAGYPYDLLRVAPRGQAAALDRFSLFEASTHLWVFEFENRMEVSHARVVRPHDPLTGWVPRQQNMVFL